MVSSDGLSLYQTNRIDSFLVLQTAPPAEVTEAGSGMRLLKDSFPDQPEGIRIPNYHFPSPIHEEKRISNTRPKVSDFRSIKIDSNLKPSVCNR